MLLIGYLLLALVVAAVLFYLVVALLPAGLTVRPIRDNRPLELPANRRLRVSDLDRVRIPVSLRGYRFAETDELIDRLAAEIQVRDEEIARLRLQGAPFSSEQPLDDAARHLVGTIDPHPAEPEWAVRDLGDQAAAELARETAFAHPAAVEPAVAVEPVVEESAAAEPMVAEESVVAESAVAESAAEEPVAESESAAAEEPMVAEESVVAEESATAEEPVAAEPAAAEEPVAGKVDAGETRRTKRPQARPPRTRQPRTRPPRTSDD
jgi:hypothetical protein